MIVLGIELSSRQGSLALLKDGVLLAEKTWIGENVRHGVLFQTLETLLREIHISYCDISLYAVGRGPGSFSGMRTAFTVAQALALPDKTEVRAVSSGAALALQVARQAGTPAVRKIAVVGDARRGQMWYGLFNLTAKERKGTQMDSPPVEGCPTGRGGFCVIQTEDWKLVSYDEISVPDGTLIVSPEAERLSKFLPEIGTARFPLARHVAELALTQSEPLEPLYMHPPVFVKPKSG